VSLESKPNESIFNEYFSVGTEDDVSMISIPGASFSSANAMQFSSSSRIRSKLCCRV